ncbi:MAG: hypothetical protein HY566_01090 [Candidatus Kerfeldbacteria bacterium]|nr:hypothetical protein [Candidatus Kerfeldbacteria bacterium]
MTITKNVPAGSTTRIRFAVQAPAKAGKYTESFALMTRSGTVLTGGTLTFPMVVERPPAAFGAKILASSGEHLIVQPGETVDYWAVLKNTGSTSWTNTGEHFVALNAVDPIGRTSAFSSSSWKASYRPAVLETPTVKFRRLGRVRFSLTAPSTPGEYVEKFQLVSEFRAWIPGGTLTIPITVLAPDPPPTATGEPVLDVGLRKTTSPLLVTVDGSFDILVDGTSSATFKKDEQVTLSYANGLYGVVSEALNASSTLPFRIVPASKDGIVELLNFDNRPSWNTQLNDNRFRGEISIRHSDATGATWIVNSLPMEQYVRGIAEAGNTSPPEYLKALMTAARTYATFHMLTKSKHAAENFHVNATTDQVYRGYGFEVRAPNVVAAAQATAGTIMTHPAAVSPSNPGGVLIAAYSSCTDGRTRNFADVFGGPPEMTPYLVSVADPNGICTNSRYLLGLDGNHMVGMSAGGALAMAEIATFDQILAYYYTGMVMKKAW